MKSIRPLYRFIRIEEISAMDPDRKVISLKFAAPAALSEKIARWLANRYVREEFINPALAHMKRVV